MIAKNGAYVSDVQLGSYELADPASPNGDVTCRLSASWHFYCPALDAIDRLCLTICSQAQCPIRARREWIGPPRPPMQEDWLGPGWSVRADQAGPGVATSASFSDAPGQTGPGVSQRWLAA